MLLGPEAAARASRDDWDRIAHAWSYEIWTAPDRQALLPGLAADLRRLHANGGPQRCRTTVQLRCHHCRSWRRLRIGAPLVEASTGKRGGSRRQSSGRLCDEPPSPSRALRSVFAAASRGTCQRSSTRHYSALHGSDRSPLSTVASSRHARPREGGYESLALQERTFEKCPATLRARG